MEEQIEYQETTDENETEVETTNNCIGNALRMALRERPRKDISRKLRDRADAHFLNDFDPENSEREKRKSKRKGGGAATIPYDDYGYLRHNGADICDCMNAECPGCWYDCEKCGSNKCGAHCRVNRKFFYETMSFDGKEKTVGNPHMPLK